MNRWCTWLLVALSLLCPSALAQSLGYVDYADEGAAYEGCMQEAASVFPIPTSNPNLERVLCNVGGGCRKSGSVFNAWYMIRDKTNGQTGGCAQDWMGKLHQHRYGGTNTCSTRPARSSGFYQQGNFDACFGGCSYNGGSVTERLVVAGKTYFRNSGLTPTGQTCTFAPDQTTEMTGDSCTKVGNLTQCVTKEGKHCAVASSGKRFCWEPNEAGIKASGNEAATKAPEGTTIKPPPKAPNNGGDWQQSGSGTVSTTTGGTTNNYNTTTWNSSYGNQGSGANGGGADGEGNGGSGDGSGEGDGDGDDWGEPGAGVGDLYEGTDKTVAGLVGQFWDQARAAPVFQGVTNFMGINATGGACPVFTLPASDFWNTMTFDAHCSGTWLALLQAMGWVVFAIASYVAVRIAVT